MLHTEPGTEDYSRRCTLPGRSGWKPETPAYPPVTLACTMWGLAAGLYMIGFFHRVYPAVIGPELMRDFAINASALGNLSAVYFYSYAAMQFPTGVLADRFGPRRVLTGGALLAAMGTFLFAFSHNFFLAGFGRLLVGGAVAVGFVTMIKLASHWMAPHRLTLVTGVAFFLGVGGALSAGYPVTALMTVMDWRWIIGVLGVMTLSLSVLIWRLVRDDPEELGYSSHMAVRSASHRQSVRTNLAAAMGTRESYLLLFAAGGLCGAVLAYAGLWGVPFLTDTVGLSRSAAALHCSTMLLSFASGGPVLGTVSEHIRHRKPVYLIAVPLSLLAWWLLVFQTPQGAISLAALHIVAGFGCGGAVILCYSHGREAVPLHAAGTMTGLINMGATGGAMLLQPLIGLLLDWRWTGEVSGGVPVYDRVAYLIGLSPVLVWLGFSILLLALTRETYCQQSQ